MRSLGSSPDGFKYKVIFIGNSRNEFSVNDAIYPFYIFDSIEDGRSYLLKTGWKEKDNNIFQSICYWGVLKLVEYINEV
jgi:hypothetical protein